MLPCGFLYQGARKEMGRARRRYMTCGESVPSWDALRGAGACFSPFTYYYSRKGPFWQSAVGFIRNVLHRKTPFVSLGGLRTGRKGWGTAVV